MYHVDLVKNEWMVGLQYQIARVALDSMGKIEIRGDDPARWRASLLRTVGDIDPTKDPEAFLAALPERLHGDYLFATEPHDERDCPFHGHPVRHLQPGPEGQASRRYSPTTT